MLRYSQGSQVRGFTITGMGYQSRWNSTDQILERLVASGELSRFGSMNTRRRQVTGHQPVGKVV